MTRARDVATQGGLTLITSNTVTSVSSVQINNCFTSTYKRYKIVLDLVGNDWIDVYGRMTSSGTADTTSNYFSGYTYITHSSGPSRGYVGSSTAMIIASVNNLGSISEVLIANPALAKRTQGIFTASNWGSNYNIMLSGGFAHNLATAYDGIYLYPNTGAITGDIKIYGIKD